MVKYWKSTLEWTQGEVIVNSGMGSHTPCFSLDSASVKHVKAVGSAWSLTPDNPVDFVENTVNL
jgi:hypothetical protein